MEEERGDTGGWRRSIWCIRSSEVWKGGAKDGRLEVRVEGRSYHIRRSTVAHVFECPHSIHVPMIAIIPRCAFFAEKASSGSLHDSRVDFEVSVTVLASLRGCQDLKWSFEIY